MKKIYVVLMIVILSSCNSMDESERIEGIYLVDDDKYMPFSIGKLEFIGSKVSIYYHPSSSTSVLSSDYKIEGDILYIEKIPQIGDIRFDIIDDDTLQGHATLAIFGGLVSDKKYFRISEEQNQRLLEHGKRQQAKSKKILYKEEEPEIKSLKELLKEQDRKDSIRQIEEELFDEDINETKINSLEEIINNTSESNREKALFESESAIVPFPTSIKGIAFDERVYFYQTPNYESRTSGYIIKGQSVLVKAQNDDFYEVEFVNNGKITKGWMKKVSIDLIGK